MKLVRVLHERCEEWEGYTYLWAPAGLTDERFQADVDAAMEEYLAAEEGLKKACEQPYGGAFLNRYPHADWIRQTSSLGVTTIADALALWKERHDIAVANRKLMDEARKPFGSYMAKKGYVHFLDNDAVMTATAAWGHRHNAVIEYGITKSQDLPGSADRDD